MQHVAFILDIEAAGGSALEQEIQGRVFIAEVGYNGLVGDGIGTGLLESPVGAFKKYFLHIQKRFGKHEALGLVGPFDGPRCDIEPALQQEVVYPLARDFHSFNAIAMSARHDSQRVPENTAIGAIVTNDGKRRVPIWRYIEAQNLIVRCGLSV